MPKYTDEDIRNMSKITCKIAADYLGISPMAVSIGMRNDLLPIGFAIHNEEYCFTEYHRFPDLLFAGSIQYDDNCHVK